MKCYAHPDVDVIGVCSECGRGICDVCAVRIGGKLYCKKDADRVFGSKRVEQEVPREVHRPMRVTVAAVLFFVCSAIAVGLGLAITGSAYSTGTVGGYR